MIINLNGECLLLLVFLANTGLLLHIMRMAVLLKKTVQIFQMVKK